MPDNSIACHVKITGSAGEGRAANVNITCNFAKASDTATLRIFIAKFVRDKLGQWMTNGVKNCLNCWAVMGSSKPSWWLLARVIPRVPWSAEASVLAMTWNRRERTFRQFAHQSGGLSWKAELHFRESLTDYRTGLTKPQEVQMQIQHLEQS